MRAVTLYRLSGLAVMIGMTIIGIASVLYPRSTSAALYDSPLAPADDLAKLAGSIIFLAGFPGLYAFEAGQAGRLGLAGFGLSFVGLAVLEVSTEALFAFVGPALAAHRQTRFLLQGGLDTHLGSGFTLYFDLSYVVIVAGFLAFGVAASRAGVYPRWAGSTIWLGAIAAIVLSPLVTVPSGPFRLDRLGVLAAAFGFAWCGWHLTRHAGDRSEDPTMPGGPRIGSRPGLRS
jgi:hypothetical protein